MDFNIAKEAIVKYLAYFSKTKLNNLTSIPIIGFYGGEPLVNFELIVKVVEFVKQIYSGSVCYSLTTNGTLLDDSSIKFLVENNFGISVSLNGYKEENDRLRVFENGNGTYEVIIKNLLRFKELYPDYYKTNCTIIMCYDSGTNLLSARDFFSSNQDIFPKIGRVNKIASAFSNWYEQYTLEENKVLKKSYQQCESIYFEQITNGKSDEFLNALVGGNYFQLLNRSINVSEENMKPHFLPYTGTCVPGTKIAVDTKGVLHCCEKGNDKIPIGTIDTWLDYDKIKTIIDNYNKVFIPYCSKCPISRMCSVCFAHCCNQEGEFDINAINNCENSIKSLKSQFSKMWSLLENGVSIENIIG